MLSYYQLFLLDISPPENLQVRNCRCLSVKMSLIVTLVTNQNAVAIHTTCILSQPRSFLVYFFLFWGLCCEKEKGLKRALFPLCLRLLHNLASYQQVTIIELDYVPCVSICRGQSGNEARNERENMVSGSTQQNKSCFSGLFSVENFLVDFSFSAYCGNNKRKSSAFVMDVTQKHRLFVLQLLQNGVNHARWRRVIGVLLTQREDAQRAHRFLPFLYQRALRLTVEIVRQILLHLLKM